MRMKAVMIGACFLIVSSKCLWCFNVAGGGGVGSNHPGMTGTVPDLLTLSGVPDVPAVVPDAPTVCPGCWSRQLSKLGHRISVHTLQI